MQAKTIKGRNTRDIDALLKEIIEQLCDSYTITINAERNADKDAVFKTVKGGKFAFLTTVKP